jgi:hypothetical protein
VSLEHSGDTELWYKNLSRHLNANVFYNIVE